MASTFWRAKPKVQPNMPARQAVVAEARELARLVAEPWLWLLVAAMALFGSLAYLSPYSVVLDIGGSPAGCNATGVFDTPYLEGFNPDPEFDGPAQQCAGRTTAFRWAFADAGISVPGTGRAVYGVVLDLPTGQPSGSAVISAWNVNQSPTLAVPIQPEGRSYHLLVPAPASGDLELHFHTPVYQPPSDPRELAFAVDRVSLASLGRTRPGWSQLITLSTIIALGYVAARRWALGPLLASLVSMVAIGAFVALLIWRRQELTAFSAQALRLMLAGFALTLVLEPLAARAAHALRIATSRMEPRAIVALVVIAWLVRVLGLFHPQTYSSDVGLHINNLLGVTRGEIIFTEGLPEEAGGGEAPYPPAQYIMLAPWQLLGLGERTLVTAANALVDSLTIFWIWLVLRVMGAPVLAAYAAGGLYLFATPLLRSLSTGEMANVWAQALVMPWLLTLLLWRQRRVGGALFGATTAIVLLSHSGIFLSLCLLLAALAVLWLVRRDQRVLQFVLVSGAAVACVTVGYYLAFLDVLGSRGEAAAASTTPFRRLGWELRELVVLDGQIGPLVAGVGLVGCTVAWRSRRTLGEVLVAWWLASLLSWGTLLVSRQALRWEAFLFPALALAGGLALAGLWRRRGALHWLAAALMAAAITHGALLWVQRLITYR